MRYLLPILLISQSVFADKPTAQYKTELRELKNAPPIFADYPNFVQPLKNKKRFIANRLIDDAYGRINVRAWRFSYNVRGIVDIPNRIRGDRTAIVVVHPWGIDDGQGWKTPEPAGVSFFCTPTKNRLYHQHVAKVLNPWLKKMRSQVRIVSFSLPGKSDPIRRKLYRSVYSIPKKKQRLQAAKELKSKLKSFRYQGQPIQPQIRFQANSKVPKATQYFLAFPGLDGQDRFNGKGFFQLPIPVVKGIDVASRDIVAYDDDGYEVFRDFLKRQGIQHILLAGYATDMCVCRTMAGYENLTRDFNVFLVGDATMATFPGTDSPAAATQAAICFASLKLLITQVSWVTLREKK